MSKINLVSLVSLVSSTPTSAPKATTALTGKENVMSENISSTPISSVYFQDSSGNWWETCTANTNGAEAFGPRGCAIRSTPPEWLSEGTMEDDWLVYQAYFRFPCIGCKGELFSQPGEFCSTCEVDGTEHTLRGGYDKLSDHVDEWCKGSSLSDKVDAQCKGSLSDTIDANCKGGWDDNDLPF